MEYKKTLLKTETNGLPTVSKNSQLTEIGEKMLIDFRDSCVRIENILALFWFCRRTAQSKKWFENARTIVSVVYIFVQKVGNIVLCF
jgi:hypothetical protein